MGIARRSFSRTLSNNVTDHNVSAPAGNTAGDTLIAFHIIPAAETADVPAGWTHIATYTSTASVTPPELGVYRRHLTTPIGTESWGIAGASPNQIVTMIVCYTGVSSVSPIEDNDGAGNAGVSGTTTLQLPAMTSTMAYAEAVLAWVVGVSNHLITVPTLSPFSIAANTALVWTANFYDETVEAIGAFGPHTASWTTTRGAATAGVLLHPLNVPPNAPLWTAPDGGVAQDVAAALTLDWTFSDDNPGDTQSAYAVKRDVAGTVRWWGGSAFDQVAETYITSTDEFLTLASSWGADGDATHFYYVRTKDALGEIGPYSEALAVIPDAKSNPTITPLGTVTTATPALNWTVTDQGQYRIRIKNAADTVTVWESGWVTDSVERGPITVGVPLENGTTYIQRVSTKTAEGLQSNNSADTFDVDFTEPDQPTLTVTEDPAGAFEVVIDNPATGETVVSNDLYVRIASASPITDGNRTKDTAGRRIATGLDPDDTYVDYIVGSQVQYEYMVRAWTAVGAFTDSAWSS